MGECFLKGFYIELLMIPPDGQTEALYRVHLIWFSYSFFFFFFPVFSQECAILGTQFERRVLMNTNTFILLFIYSQNKTARDIEQY